MCDEICGAHSEMLTYVELIRHELERGGGAKKPHRCHKANILPRQAKQQPGVLWVNYYVAFLMNQRGTLSWGLISAAEP